MVVGRFNAGGKVVPAITVITSVSVQPNELVYVIVVVPIVNPFTTPVFDIEATDGLDETHGFIVATGVVADNVIESPAPTIVVPEITGNGFTTTLKSEVLATVQDPLVTTARNVEFCVRIAVVSVVFISPNILVHTELSRSCH